MEVPEGEDYYDAPLVVKECVKRRWLEFYRALGPRHIDEFDPDRAAELGIRRPDEPFTEVPVVRHERRAILVTGFSSSDGLRCQVRDYMEGCVIRVYTWPRKEFLREEKYPDSKVVIYYMAYRPTEGDWFLSLVTQPGEPKFGTSIPLPNGIPPEIIIEAGGLVEGRE